MASLSLVFASFDGAAEKYPLLTKIKLIGDVYMAAAGLFLGPDDNVTQHAVQTVKFAFDALSQLDEANVNLGSSLNVRIGVNSGGPLLAGVLGTDKPVFDIIGDTINVSARLQSTDLPGMVQISATTKDLIKDAEFYVTERGEVYLKGKGKQMTYFVHSTAARMAPIPALGSFAISSREITNFDSD
jgi:guanylate cyclase